MTAVAVTDEVSQQEAEQCTASKSLVELTPLHVKEMLRTKQAILIDVREADEHARERIKGAKLMPLSRFDAAKIVGWLKPGQRAIMQCKSGKRAAEACRIATALEVNGIPVVSLVGGIEGWKSAGLPVEVDTGVCAISVMRQVQLTIGIATLIGCALAWFVNPAFLVIPAFFGAGLTVAGASGTCGLASVLSAMPWNRPSRNKVTEK